MDRLEDDLFAQFISEQPEDRPYSGGAALMDDLLRLISMLCLAYGEINHNEDVPYHTRGLVVREETFYQALMARSQGAGREGPLPGAVLAAAHIRARVEISLEQGVYLPFAALVRRFALKKFEAFCLLLAVCTDLDRRFEQSFAFLQDDVKCTRATLGLAWDLYSLVETVPEAEVYSMLDRHRPVNELLLTDWQNNADRSTLARPLAVPKQLLYLFTGVELAGIDDLETKVMRGSNAPVLWNEDKISAGTAFMDRALQDRQGEGMGVLYLFGESGQGKSFALSQMARRLQRSVLEVDASALMGQRGDALVRVVAIRCLLDGLIPCLDRLRMDEPGTKEMVLGAIGLLRRYFPLLIVCADRPWDFPKNMEVDFQAIEFPMPGVKERYAFWEEFGRQGSGAPISETELAALAGRYRLNPAEICSLSRTLALGKEEGLGWVAQAMREQARSRLGSLAQHLPSAFRWEDLQLPEEASKMLRSACTRIQYRYQVNENWGFSRRLPYGQGISVLLYGPPGTGKSMTAQVLSREVGLDLFRVDLSQIVDKYIGETEKNLGRLFDTADGVNCILFFDEADALFSKRTEVGDSKDKYANVETAYLLQRIEQFPGITVLATNNARNFDEAFRRRMTYFINVPMPDQATRQRIWEAVFPKQLPLDRGVSFAELAEKFEFSGSSIKSVAVSAAYAAAAAGTPVTRRSIFEALQIEYLKTGKLLGLNDYPC